MSHINVNTTQHVTLQYEAAGVGYRILAALLDGVFIVVYASIVLLLIYASGGFSYYNERNYMAIALVILFSLPVLLYHFLSESFMNGQSLGKKILGIKVVKLDGTQPGIGSYLLRSIMRIIDVQISNGVVALISVSVSEKSQRLGDMAAGTTVIKIGEKIRLNQTILYAKIDNYKITFEQVALLSDTDIATIKEILQHSLQNNKPQHIIALALKVKTKMGVETNLNNELFLKTILLDYSHYQFEK